MQNITYHKATQADVQTLVDMRIAFSIELMGAQTQQHISELKTHLSNYFTQSINKTCIAYLAKQNNNMVGVGELIIRTQAGENVYIKNGFHKHTEPTYRKYI